MQKRFFQRTACKKRQKDKTLLLTTMAVWYKKLSQNQQVEIIQETFPKLIEKKMKEVLVKLQEE